MDREALEYIFKKARWSEPYAHVLADSLIAELQSYCEHRWAVWEDAVYHLGLPDSGIVFCGKCGQEKP